MENRESRYKERMRQKQLQLQRRRMMKKVTYVLGVILLFVFVIRGIIFPIITRIGGGSTNTEEPADVKAENEQVADEDVLTAEAETEAEASPSAAKKDNGITMALRQPIRGMADLEKAIQLTAGWHTDSNGKWYRNTDGTYYVSGFQKIDGNQYAFDENGYVRTGWFIDGSKEYFFEDNGVYDPKIRRPMLALTYDDGPGQYTDQLLDCLEQNNAVATFFMLGEHVKGYEKEINRMLEIGCELGNHSYDHPNLFNLDLDDAARQFERTDELLIEACGQPSSVARCPYGNGNSDIFEYVGKPFFMWSLDSLDWSYMDVSMDIDAVLNGDLTDGSIILMHDIHQPSVEASLTIIPELVERGYRLVTVSELAAAKGVDLQHASYSDFWDSSLAGGWVKGYRGEGWDEIEEDDRYDVEDMPEFVEEGAEESGDADFEEDI